MLLGASLPPGLPAGAGSVLHRRPAATPPSPQRTPLSAPPRLPGVSSGACACSPRRWRSYWPASCPSLFSGMTFTRVVVWFGQFCLYCTLEVLEMLLI